MPSIGNNPETAQARGIQPYLTIMGSKMKDLTHEKSDDLIKFILHYADYGYFS